MCCSEYALVCVPRSDFLGPVQVCRRVLTEGNPEHIRTLAQGLSEMGRIFSEAGTPARSDTAQPSAKQTVEDAMLKVVEKRHQMDEKLYGDN